MSSNANNLRKIEINLPHSFKDVVLNELQTKGGIGFNDHVGENICVLKLENCTRIELCCSSQRSGELVSLLSSLRVGMDFGTVTVMNVTSMRPNPINLLEEFNYVKKKLVDANDRMETERERAMENASNETLKRQKLKGWRRGMRVGNFLPFKGMKWNHGRRFKEEALNKKFKYITAKAEKSVEELWNEIIDFSIDSKAFYVSALAASIISALGLLTDSPVIVLSAMLISPLMGPILSGAFALAIKDWVLLFESILAELRAAAFTFGVGFVSCAIFGGYYESRSTIPTNEMLSRTTESGLVSGAIIALASGIIVGNAVTSSGVNSLVGVAISASLLPPIVNSGILVALSVLYCQDSEESCSGQRKFFKEALYSLSLYAENVLIIAVIAAFIFYSQRMGEVKSVYGSHSHVLNLSDPLIQKKLKLAAGVDLFSYDRAFTKLQEEKEIKRDVGEGGRGKEEDVEKGGVLVAPSNATRKIDAPEEEEEDNNSKKEELSTNASSYSALRPFDEPAGVHKPEFLKDENAISLSQLNDVWKRFKKQLIGWEGDSLPSREQHPRPSSSSPGLRYDDGEL
ncbi:unnamed protein product [Bathycoccus prasinos]|mmetsp:Transcript_5244/g.16673  ORF Transcript_5244/g.16673 Transcript_5244/m.16673 type:complete len:572 (+) Transcript_5244:181-1896(+)